MPLNTKSKKRNKRIFFTCEQWLKTNDNMMGRENRRGTMNIIKNNMHGARVCVYVVYNSVHLYYPHRIMIIIRRMMNDIYTLKDETTRCGSLFYSFGLHSFIHTLRFGCTFFMKKAKYPSSSSFEYWWVLCWQIGFRFGWEV